VPALFRDIFKNAYLPYRDPETLKSFLKESSTTSATTTPSAWATPLSTCSVVLGSQGDAGQFRTPRHIIDFMVEVLIPEEGTNHSGPGLRHGRLLISAWKHILRNTTPTPKRAPSDNLLTPDERPAGAPTSRATTSRPTWCA
jgi:type I restriction enzyme M protein